MKKKFIIAAYLLLFVVLIILWKTFFTSFICGFYNICEWGIYIFVVPTAFLLISLFSNTSKPFLMICAITSGVIIQALLSRDWETGFVVHKLAATLFGCLITYLITKHINKK